MGLGRIRLVIEDGSEADRKFDCAGVGDSAQGRIASVPASHRECQQDGRGAGDGAEYGAQGEQNDDGTRSQANSGGQGKCNMGGGGEEVRRDV